MSTASASQRQRQRQRQKRWPVFPTALTHLGEMSDFLERREGEADLADLADLADILALGAGDPPDTLGTSPSADSLLGSVSCWSCSWSCHQVNACSADQYYCILVLTKILSTDVLLTDLCL